MIRYLSLNAFIAVWTIIMSTWGIMISMVDKTGRNVHFYCAVPWAKIILRVCGIRVRVGGLGNLNTDLPRIYMTNHQSFFDIFALLACLPVNFKFILKQELMNLPVFGSATRRAGYIGIERDDPRKAVKSMNQAAERIKSGASVLIFPEGTRSPDGRLGQFKKGGFSLAIKSGCDIVPVAISGSHRIAPKGSLRIKKGSFSLSIGKPISLAGYTKRKIPQLMDQVREAMLRQMEKSGSTDGLRANTSFKKVGMILLITSFLFAIPGGSSGYVMPVDQLIDKMRAKFSNFKTLIIDQSTHVLDPQDQETTMVFQEKTWLKSPGYCHSEVTGRPESLDIAGAPASPQPPGKPAQREGQVAYEVAETQGNSDTAFRWLLMANDRDTIMTFLAQMGVNLESVGFTRFDGIIAYRIGDKGPESPKLLIHKESFLPLLFSYVPLRSSSQDLAIVRFDNYTRVDSGWYPYEIDYSVKKERVERYFVLNIRVNPPIETSFFRTTTEKTGIPQKPENDQDGQQEERLKEVIRLLKEKYGN